MLDTFVPVFFDNHRYCAIAKDGMYFVADANVYDNQNNDRATITYCGNIRSLPTLIGLIAAISGQVHYEYVDTSKQTLWMLETDTQELIYMYEQYVSSLHHIILPDTEFDRQATNNYYTRPDMPF